MTGRPPFEPTAEQRGMVEAMTGFGIPGDQIARLIINPQTREPISPTTLSKAFRRELDIGYTKANAEVSKFIFQSIAGREGGIKDERSRATLAMFWAKTRMGWKETLAHEHAGKDGKPLESTDAKHLIVAALDRIAERITGDAVSDNIENGSGEDPR